MPGVAALFFLCAASGFLFFSIIQIGGEAYCNRYDRIPGSGSAVRA